MEIKPKIESLAVIKVVGIGGGGNAAVNRMINAKIKGVEFIAVNTDAQALAGSKAPVKIHIGENVTRGLGAGMDPELGRRAAEESSDILHESLRGADMIFITCGMGGGTGTGGAPVIAEIAKDVSALVVAVVTKPFSFEGQQRMNIANRGHEELAQRVDAIITVPNDRLLQVIDKKVSLLDAFEIVDEVLKQGVQGISELITQTGNINADFNDVKAIMNNAGSALMGIGKSSGENRAVEAAKAAISSPLLEMSVDGAKGILFNISGDAGLAMVEVNEAARIITSAADPNAKIIWGVTIDETLGAEVKITVIAAGFGEGSRPQTSSHAPSQQQPPAVTTSLGGFRFRPVAKVETKPPAMSMDKEEVVQPKNSFMPSPISPKITQATMPEIPADDLDIPSILRKKLHKEE